MSVREFRFAREIRVRHDHVGLRLGEALALGWHDVDLVGGTLTVRRSLQRVDGKLQFVEPKTEKSRRTVLLPPVAVELLKRHRTRQRKERLLAGGDRQESGLAFTSTLGTPLDERNVRRAFKEVLTTAKLPKMRIHDLRHTCATLLLARGVHPKVVGEILGHSQVSLTLDTYSTVLPSVSVAGELVEFAGVFEPLRDPELFAQATSILSSAAERRRF